MPTGKNRFALAATGAADLCLELQGQPLGRLPLDTDLQPGSPVEFSGQTYVVLERRHRYQFRAGQYRLRQVILQVQSVPLAQEQSEVDHDWVLGDASCRFSARSQLICCAVNPAGPCQGCSVYEPVSPTSDSSPSLSPISSRAPLAKSQPD